MNFMHTQVRWRPGREASRYRPKSTLLLCVAPALGAALAPQFENIVEFERAPWLPGVLDELRALEERGQNIAGVGDLRVERATADKARRLLSMVSAEPLPKPQVIPFSGGGIALTWDIGEKEMNFSMYPGQEQLVFLRTNEYDEIAEDGLLSLDNAELLYRLLNGFLSNEAQ
ncbi:MAG: hypothetical protein ACRD50_03965 [Candidatus Acidiferrales bacterium]